MALSRLTRTSVCSLRSFCPFCCVKQTAIGHISLSKVTVPDIFAKVNSPNALALKYAIAISMTVTNIPQDPRLRWILTAYKLEKRRAGMIHLFGLA